MSDQGGAGRSVLLVLLRGDREGVCTAVALELMLPRQGKSRGFWCLGYRLIAPTIVHTVAGWECVVVVVAASCGPLPPRIEAARHARELDSHPPPTLPTSPVSLPPLASAARPTEYRHWKHEEVRRTTPKAALAWQQRKPPRPCDAIARAALGNSVAQLPHG